MLRFCFTDQHQSDFIKEKLKIRQKAAILLTKTTAAQSEGALSYYKVHRLYFLAIVFVRSIGTDYGLLLPARVCAIGLSIVDFYL